MNNGHWYSCEANVKVIMVFMPKNGSLSSVILHNYVLYLTFAT